jgi:hypothetical protein
MAIVPGVDFRGFIEQFEARREPMEPLMLGRVDGRYLRTKTLQSIAAELRNALSRSTQPHSHVHENNLRAVALIEAHLEAREARDKDSYRVFSRQ